MARFDSVGVIKNALAFNSALLRHFTESINSIKSKPSWGKAELVDVFNEMIPDFAHKETGKYLDARM